MGPITLPNVRTSSDITVRARLKDGGIYIDWTSLSEVKAYIYSDNQRALAGRCDVSVDGSDSTVLVCTYAATKPQYPGVNSLIVRGTYMGRMKTYDAKAFNLVNRTTEVPGDIVLDDPVVDLSIEVTDVSSSILDAAILAAIDAAGRANEAAEEAEHMVDIHTGPKGDDGAAAGFGAVTADVGLGPDPGPAVYVTASGPATAKRFHFDFVNIIGEKGDKGDKGDKGETGATGPQGQQGNTGSSIDYPFTIVNNLTTNDPAQALSAAQGVVLRGDVDDLEDNVGDLGDLMTDDKSSLVGAINEAGFSGSAKTALINLLEKVAYIDDDGRGYLETLYALLFPGIVSIDAVFTQGQAVIYDEDDLSSLKQYLVVTALYQDGTTRVLPDNAYVLSGTLEAGTSTITVSFAGKTDTFTVTVTATPREVLFGVFTDGYAVSKITSIGQYPHRTYRSAVAARATTQVPFENKGYVFTVTDSTKYNLAVYDIESLTQVPSPPNVGAVDDYCYMGEDKAISWKTEDSVSTPYAWLALKKMDGTAFTSEELADGAAEVFTFTKGI